MASSPSSRSPFHALASSSTTATSLSVSPAGCIAQDSPHTPSLLARGQCRAILTVPGIRGQRCACVGFSLNIATPGAACHCGHQSCYHLPEPIQFLHGQDEFDQLRLRLHELEKLARGQSVLAESERLAALEKKVDKAVDDFQLEIRASFRNSGAAWKLAQQLQSRVLGLETESRIQSQKLAKSFSSLADLRDRQLELWDYGEGLEEKLELLLPSERPICSMPDIEQASKASCGLGTPPLTNPATTAPVTEPRRLPVPPLIRLPSPSLRVLKPALGGIWTVHVHLVLSKHQVHPFEKDTPAYLRCLSRGLYRTIVVQNTDAQSFTDAIDKVFGTVLERRPWEVLGASPEVTQDGQQNTRLQPLNSAIGHRTYTKSFLEANADVDKAGKLERIYISPSRGVLTWDTIRHMPVHVEGLEQCWQDDAKEGMEEEEAACFRTSSPMIKEMLVPKSASPPTSTTSSLKRRASQMMSGGHDEETSNSLEEELMMPMSKMQRFHKGDAVGLGRTIEPMIQDYEHVPAQRDWST